MENQRKLHMAKASSWRHIYEMREGDMKIAALELHNSHGSRATLHGDDFTMTVIRTNFLPKEIEIYEDGEGVAHTFHAGWDSRGSVSLRGKKYFWVPANRTWTTWKWENEKGDELVRLSYNPFRPFAARGRVNAHPSLSVREVHCLGLLGWYLILLDFELAGSRMLSLMELGVRKFKRIVAAS